MVRTKCLFNRVVPSDGRRFVVSYKLPSKDYVSFDKAMWEPDLAPFPKMVNEYHAGQITWKEYTSLYLAKMKLTPAVKAIEKLAKLSLIQDITLLCYEKEDNPQCHRHLLKVLIDRKASKLSAKDAEGDKPNKEGRQD